MNEEFSAYYGFAPQSSPQPSPSGAAHHGMTGSPFTVQQTVKPQPATLSFTGSTFEVVVSQKE